MRRARDRASRVDAHPERGLKPNIISLNSLYIQNTLYIASYVYLHDCGLCVCVDCAVSPSASLCVRVGPSRGRVAAPRSLYFEVRAEVRGPGRPPAPGRACREDRWQCGWRGAS